MNTSMDRTNNTLNKRPSMATTVGLGILAGLAGTVVMTVFQELIEKPVTERGDSFAPLISPRRSPVFIRPPSRVGSG